MKINGKVNISTKLSSAEMGQVFAFEIGDAKLYMVLEQSNFDQTADFIHCVDLTDGTVDGYDPEEDVFLINAEVNIL